jgi:hypothetical protein
MSHALPRWSLAVPLVFIAIGSTSCATPRDRAGAIVAAATAGHLSPVVACWEKEYETSGFQGEYIAIVDFEIGANEHFSNARVISLESVDKSAPTHDMTAFRECVEKALDQVEPRADRCQGMYMYNPPRDTSTLFTEISVVQSKPASAQDKDAQAREFQRMYDMQLELAARLEADLTNRTLPAVNRKRLQDALEQARGEIARTAERIGCGAKRPEK